MKPEKRSKAHFRDAAIRDTWADDSKWPFGPRARILALSMDVMQPNAKICLSLGCGLGRFLRAYSERNAKLVIGVDINLHNLFMCRNTGASLIRCDIEHLPIRKNCIEALECVATVEHLPHPLELIKEICRVSATNAISFVTWVSFDWRRATGRKLRSAIDAVFDVLPASVSETACRLRIPYLRDYGLFRNKGFSFLEVSEIYDAASLQITWSKRFADEQVIAVTATPVRKLLTENVLPDLS